MNKLLEVFDGAIRSLEYQSEDIVELLSTMVANNPDKHRRGFLQGQLFAYERSISILRVEASRASIEEESITTRLTKAGYDFR